MTLSEILTRIRTFSSIADRDSLVDLVNDTAKELWNSMDMPGSLLEDTFRADNGIISLPYNIGRVRAVRRSDRIPIELNTPTVGYMDDSWFQDPLSWRELFETPQTRAITNASRLTFSRPAEELALDITLIGPTDKSARVVETVSLAESDTTAVTVNNFTEISSARKSVENSVNITATDVDGNEILFFANHFREAVNTVIQVTEPSSTFPTPGTYYDILYLPRLPRMVNDEDVFPEPFDLSLITMIKSLVKLETTNAENLSVAAAFTERARGLFRTFGGSHSLGKTLRMNMKRNTFTSSSGYKL